MLLMRHHIKSERYPSERLLGSCLSENCIIGIDEAGRGPVLGPLVYSLFICPESQAKWLGENGAHDSKQLTEGSRKSFFHWLLKENEDHGWRVKILHPELISNCMLRRDKFNLNELSYSTVFSLITSVLDDGVKVTAAFVDTLGKAEKYEAVLSRKFPNIRFTVRSKADSTFPVVGAASIVAKVIRDDILGQEGIATSGYPSDPTTIAWLHNNIDPVFGFPRMVRFSWSTCHALLAEKCYLVKWLDEEGNDDANNGRINKEKQGKRSIRSLLIKPFNSPLGLFPCKLSFINDD